MKIDYEVYRPEHLNEKDKQRWKDIQGVRDRLMQPDVIEDYLENKKINGSVLQGVYRDVLKDFSNFLSERIGFCEVDLLLECIDGYSEEEFDALCEKARQEEENRKNAGCPA